MYFPYLRGRQYELLALRDLLERECIGEHVIPIVEPLKLSATLIKALEYFASRERPIAVIHNPKVGSFADELEQLAGSPLREAYERLLSNQVIIKAHILNHQSQTELAQLTPLGVVQEDLLIICENRDVLDLYGQHLNYQPSRYHLIPGDSAFRRKLKANRVLLDDKFTKQLRNVDYLKTEDEFFSEDHIYFADENYIGFSDYSIVGRPYTESGFAPFAIAIHIVYFDELRNLRIKHFVSDSNEDLNDPAGKFYEAVTKLTAWYREVNVRTYGIDQLVGHFEAGTYPGLGIVKKLSIMHHLELVSRYLDEVL